MLILCLAKVAKNPGFPDLATLSSSSFCERVGEGKATTTTTTTATANSNTNFFGGEVFGHQLIMITIIINYNNYLICHLPLGLPR